MINSFFGFTRLPFQGLHPNSEIFKTNSLNILEQRLSDFCITKGIALVCGETGSGKTTAVRHLITHSLDTHRFKPIYFSQYPSQPKGFLRLIISELGYTPRFFLEDLIPQFPSLIEEFKSLTKMTPLFVFDEAQNMPMAILEQVRLLTNIAHDKAPLLALIAHGAFLDKLKLACFQPLRYRLSLISFVDPLSKSDIQNYMAFHLKLAGCDRMIFSQEAITSIFNISKGLPRIINRIAFESLYFAANKNLAAVDQDCIESAALLAI